MSANKQPYEAPQLDFVGTFETITQTTSSGFTLDAHFDGTPVAGELSEP